MDAKRWMYPPLGASEVEDPLLPTTTRASSPAHSKRTRWTLRVGAWTVPAWMAAGVTFVLVVGALHRCSRNPRLSLLDTASLPQDWHLSPQQRLAQLNHDYNPDDEGLGGARSVDLDRYRDELHAAFDDLLPLRADSSAVDGLSGGPSTATVRAQLDCLISLDCRAPPPPIPNELFATERVVSPVPPTLVTWLDQNPSLRLTLLNDSAVDQWVRRRFADSPRLLTTWADRLPLPILRFDLFRLLALVARGGVYTDGDTRALRPLSAWSEGVAAFPPADRLLAPTLRDNGTTPAPPSLVVGIEWKGHTEHNARNPAYSRSAGVVQWTFAGAAGHPVFVDATRRVLRHSERVAALRNGDDPREDGEGPLQFDYEADRMVLEWSGPAVLTDSVARYLRTRYGLSLAALASTPTPVRVGDVLLLPVQALNARTSVWLKLLDWTLGRGWAPWSPQWSRGSVVHEHAAGWWKQHVS
ncbi:hypothetical protein JCM6882_007976 [Rhodosporidiobolus microsporus]